MTINKNYRESRHRNKKYWEERARARSDVFVEDSEKIADELGKAYYSSSKIVEKEIAKVFQGFENAFGLSHAEAKRLIENAAPDVPSKELIGIINGLTDNDLKQQLLGYISAPAYQYRINRLDEAVARAEKVCKSLYSSELHTDTEFFSSEIEKAYNHTIFDIQQGTGITGAFNQIPKSRIEEIMKNRWSGRHYSSRIWGNTSRLAQTLKNNLLESFITGESEQKAAARVRERFGVAAHNARCLVRTENTYITNQAEISGYKEAQVDEYEYMAVMDDDTSPICRRLNGRSFPVSKARAGFNLPPMHPFCRSTTIGKIPSEEELDAVWDKDMADMVPEDMEFEEWLDRLEPTEDGKLVFRDKRVDKSAESSIIKLESEDDIEYYNRLNKLEQELKSEQEKTDEKLISFENDIWDKYGEPEQWPDHIEKQYSKMSELIESIGVKIESVVQKKSEAEINAVHQLADKIKEIGGFNSVNINGCNFKSAESIYNSIDICFKTVPQLKGKIGYLELKRIDDLRDHAYTTIIVGEKLSVSGITLNKSLFTDIENSGLLEKLNKDILKNHHPVETGSPLGVISHEFGHAIDVLLRNNGNAMYGANKSKLLKSVGWDDTKENKNDFIV
ncbi:MAG: minor capsid protein, partial [Ruminiclostridium sp.]